MFDFILEFLLDAVGDLFDRGIDAATDVGPDAALDPGVGAGPDPSTAFAAPLDAGGGAPSFGLGDNPVSAALRSAGIVGPV